MFGARSRGLLLFAAVSVSMLTAASGATIGPSELHREAVDEQRYPWSSVGKLYNETGGSCSGVVISRDRILTAAHCLFNDRTQRFIPAAALHFLVGYRTGRYSVHARIVSYEIGAGFDPLRYNQTSDADWAVLTVTESLPADIEPLRLRRELAPSGTKAVLVGYPRDRAFAMTADRDCELREKISAGRLMMHTCRGIQGYSGAPILVSAGGNEMQVAGIQIASMQSGGVAKMIAVPAQSIWRQDRDGTSDPTPVVEASAGATSAGCDAASSGDGGVSWETVRARLDLDSSLDPPDTVSSIPEGPGTPAAGAMAWLASEPFAIP
jgi:protease YdgD